MSHNNQSSTSGVKDILQAIVFGGLFLVPFLPFYVENDFFFPFITGKNFAFRIIVEVVFAAWILLALTDVKYRPKFSWIIAGFAALIVVMAAANSLGEYPLKSFWSNFERMDGYVTLVHVFLYTVVLGSVITTEKLWSYFLHTSCAVAFCVAVYGLGQYGGVIDSSNGSRVDSRLGNAAYMAVYMLFHLFFLGYLAVRSKVVFHRVLYGIIAIILVYTLLLTGTRGTFLGFVGGTTAAITYIALFGRKVPELRKYAIAGILGLVILGLSFVAVRDTDFIQDNSSLSRIANIDLKSDLVVRSTIWGMAWEGVKERPLLGWGQGNFNYVFNEQYEPSLYAQEQWFDRVHNIFFDWLIAGGILGFLAYFSIMIAILYYLLIEPVFMRKESTFSVQERAVLFGLIVGYLMHNLVVFDNIISYIFYGTVLALIHSRVGTVIKKVEEYHIDRQIITQFATPIVLLLTGFGIYFANVPGMYASADTIDALVAPSLAERIEEFDNALGHNSFANQEIIEQLAQQAMNLSQNQNIPEADRQNIAQRAEKELLALADAKPGDARVHNFIASFYRATGNIEKAREHASLAVSFSPKKPGLILEQAIVELQANDPETALLFLEKGFRLEERNTQARVLYAAVLLRTGEAEAAKELITQEYVGDFAMNNYAVASAEAARDMEFLAALFIERVAREPQNLQHRASLAFVYYQLEDIETSVEVLTQAAEDIPEFAPLANCYVENLQAGNLPEEGCSQ